MAVAGLAVHRETGRQDADEDLQGSDGWKPQRCETLQLPSDAQLQRQGAGCAQSVPEQRCRHTRRGRGAVAHRCREDESGQIARPEPLQGKAPEKGRDPEEEREEETSRNLNDARPGHANTVPARSRPHLRGDIRPEFVWIQGRSQCEGCLLAGIHRTGEEVIPGMGAGRGHKGMLRPYLP